jgi:hypothetical protein
MSSKPRCGQCQRPGTLRRTGVGLLCKRCASRLPPHLARDPDQPKPNAARSLRPSKQGGLWTTRAQAPRTTKATRRALKGK